MFITCKEEHAAIIAWCVISRYVTSTDKMIETSNGCAVSIDSLNLSAIRFCDHFELKYDNNRMGNCSASAHLNIDQTECWISTVGNVDMIPQEVKDIFDDILYEIHAEKRMFGE